MFAPPPVTRYSPVAVSYSIAPVLGVTPRSPRDSKPRRPRRPSGRRPRDHPGTIARASTAEANGTRWFSTFQPEDRTVGYVFFLFAALLVAASPPRKGTVRASTVHGTALEATSPGFARSRGLRLYRPSYINDHTYPSSTSFPVTGSDDKWSPGRDHSVRLALCCGPR